ncbi:restriction endonuclease subunit S [Novispirillum itersonii]|uniref:Type I restriction enzyme S subunit n=1 Tax=Novispirillum itersonii TaxID=189 RepID=A0A7W9ZIR2_NOVIT|nr:restriction endonuclease subunit S [Novispirillum itersonii]MBB6211768.1 type I restriction enzyme S subunit [Novispirillum itersonii]
MSFPRYPAYKDSGIEWLGEVPEHWKVAGLKRKFSVVGGSTPKSDVSSYWEGDIVWVTPADLSGLNDFYITTSYRQITDAGLSSCGASMVPEGSIILSTRAPIGSIGISIAPLCTNQGCKALVPNKPVSSKFYAYLLKSVTYELNIQGKGTTFLELSGDALAAFNVPIPTTEEQSTIAAFLDRETGKIDALMAKQERLIDLLKEKRQAVISHAVTKGLDPSAPLKDSGIDWLGQVPEHWEVKPLKRISKIGNGATPLKDEPRYWENGTYPWLNSSVVNDESVRSSETFITETALAECSLPRVKPPAILVGITGEGRTRGMATTLLFEATINQHVAYIKPLDESLHVGYLRRFFDMAYDRLRFESDGGGSTKGAITCEQLCRTKTPLPPPNEQSAISAYLELKIDRFDTLITEAQRAIALLKEHRSALISAAVTGKIDVRGLAPAPEAAA